MTRTLRNSCLWCRIEVYNRALRRPSSRHRLPSAERDVRAVHVLPLMHVVVLGMNSNPVRHRVTKIQGDKNINRFYKCKLCLLEFQTKGILTQWPSSLCSRTALRFWVSPVRPREKSKFRSQQGSCVVSLQDNTAGRCCRVRKTHIPGPLRHNPQHLRLKELMLIHVGSSQKLLEFMEIKFKFT